MRTPVRPTLGLLTLCTLLCLWSPSSAQPGADPLPRRLAEIVESAHLGDQVGVSVLYLSTGRGIYSHHADLPLNPASNMKLVTAAAALLRLGPDFTMLTGLYGRVEDGVVQELALVGSGDPTIDRAALVDMAQGLVDRGVRRVGAVVVDGSYFDDQVLPPAFEQQPDESAYFRAPVAAVAVSRSAYELRVLPGPAVGSPARVLLPAAGYFAVEGEITTADGGDPAVVADQRAADDGRLRLMLRGTVPASILGVGYLRRVEDPLAYAGHALVEALGRVGIPTGGSVRLGQVDPGAPLLVRRRSRPLAEIITAMGKDSDNFTAETVLKVLGAERARPGSSATGCQVLQDVLAEAGVPTGEATLINGSGLFTGNRIAASHLTRLLTHMYRSPGVRAEYVSHLAVAGDDGTLDNRLVNLSPARVVRAKTGTLNDAIALSGYVLGRSAGEGVAFSVLVNGAAGRHGPARGLADGIVRALVAHLHAPTRDP